MREGREYRNGLGGLQHLFDQLEQLASFDFIRLENHAGLSPIDDPDRALALGRQRPNSFRIDTVECHKWSLVIVPRFDTDAIDPPLACPQRDSSQLEQTRRLLGQRTKTVSQFVTDFLQHIRICLLYTSPSPRD